MFGKKELKCPDPFKDKVKCRECRCWLDKSDSHEVDVCYGMDTQYYCHAHKKPYSRIILPGWYGVLGDSAPRYFGEVQMTEGGIPVGYKKIIK